MEKSREVNQPISGGIMTYRLKYIAEVFIDVEAKDEEQAFSMADAVLESMTGADFREFTDYDNIEEL